MLSELARSVRLCVRLPVEPIVRHPLEHLASEGHLMVELGEQGIDERHPPSAYDGLLPKLTLGRRSASGGALNSGCSLKPKMPAVTFDGNDRRDVL